MTIPNVPYNWRPSSAEFNAWIDELNDAIGQASATGDVIGPSSAGDNRIARFDGTTGKVVQNSAVTVDDSGDIATSGSLSIAGGSSNIAALNLGLGGGVYAPVYPPLVDWIATAETTTSTSYADLATVGPTVTMTTGNLVRITFGCHMRRTAGSNAVQVAMAVSGATTLAAASSDNVNIPGGSASSAFSTSSTSLLFRHLTVVAKVNPGSNNFTMKYSVGASTTGEYSNRFIMVERID